MRILHTIAARDWGGIAYRTVEQVAWLNGHGHSAWLACPADSEISGRAAEAGVPTVDFNFDRPFFPSTMWRLRHLVRRLQCDVVEAHTGRCANAALAVRNCCTIVRTRHTTQPLKPTLWRWLRWRWGWDWTVVTAQTIADGLVDVGLAPQERISVIGEWVEDRFFGREQWPEWRQVWRRTLGVGDDAFLVGAIGMLRPEKGFDTLIRAIGRMANSCANVVAVIVGTAAGDGAAYACELSSLVNELGLAGRIHFIGYQDDIPGLLQAFDAVVVPSIFEAQSRVVPEALASERPIVASRVGGITELIHDGENGWLVWPGDPNALASRLAKIRGGSTSMNAVCRAAGAFARKTLHIDSKMEEYLCVYEQAITRRGRTCQTFAGCSGPG